MVIPRPTLGCSCPSSWRTCAPSDGARRRCCSRSAPPGPALGRRASRPAPQALCWPPADTCAAAGPPPSPPQVVRQRDTLRQLLQSSGNDLDAARQAYAASLGGAASPSAAAGAGTPGPGAGTPGQAADSGTRGGTPSQAGGPDYRALHADLESQFKDYKEEAAKTQDMLSKDVSPGRAVWADGFLAQARACGVGSRPGRATDAASNRGTRALCGRHLPAVLSFGGAQRAGRDPACSPETLSLARALSIRPTPPLDCSWPGCGRRRPLRRARRAGRAPRPTLSATAPRGWPRVWICSGSRWGAFLVPADGICTRVCGAACLPALPACLALRPRCTAWRTSPGPTCCLAAHPEEHRRDCVVLLCLFSCCRRALLLGLAGGCWGAAPLLCLA